MPDDRFTKWADAVVDFSVEVKPGQIVSISGEAAAEPLLRAIYRAVLDRGAHPVLTVALSELSADFFSRASDDQLRFISPIERFVREEADVSIRVLAESNTKVLSGVDPGRQSIFQESRRELFQTFMQRAADDIAQWTLTLFPTPAYAQDAAMSTEDFAEFVFKACKLDTPDPIAAWKELAVEQQRLIDWLADKEELHLIGPDVHLKVNVAGRTWINSDGRRNFPSGEIFTGPHEKSTEGTVRFSFPAIYNGREVSDIRLRFEGGKVVDASAGQNEAFLIQQLDTDEGARYLGEFAFGTNFGISEFTKNILFDEKIGGTVHMALGLGYPDTGSTNVSAIHWDMICDLRQGGRVEADGQPFLVEGQFVI